MQQKHEKTAAVKRVKKQASGKPKTKWKIAQNRKANRPTLISNEKQDQNRKKNTANQIGNTAAQAIASIKKHRQIQNAAGSENRPNRKEKHPYGSKDEFAMMGKLKKMMQNSVPFLLIPEKQIKQT